MDATRHILVLVDRDWTHPQTGGNGASLIGQVSRWVQWGHRVTVIAGEYPGAPRVERFGPNLVVHRMGTRTTVFPRAIARVVAGLAHDADVVLEIVNGITFLTPLWLRKPRVVQVLHVHRDIYTGEYGERVGLPLHTLLEVLPLRHLYRDARFLTISESAAEDLVGVGIRREQIRVEYCGMEPGPYARGERAPEPRIVFVGRLKAYKRVERILDVLDAVPEATLDVAGDGDHREALELEVARRGLGDRVRMHGYVSEETKARLYAEAWVNMTASQSEGWSLTVIEAALCGTPSAALSVGGLAESIIDGVTGVLADGPGELVARVRALLADPDRRARMADAAEERARSFTWERTAAANLAVLEEAAARGRPARRLALSRSDGARTTTVAAAAAAAATIAIVTGLRRHS